MLAKLFRRRKKISTTAPVAVREEAGRLFASGCNCAQAVLRATTGTDNAELLQIAKAFGGGVGGSKCLCGAVSGAIMALGLRGREDSANRLVGEFRQTHGATCCVALSRNFRWNSREHRANCRRITEQTAEAVARLLDE